VPVSKSNVILRLQPQSSLNFLFEPNANVVEVKRESVMRSGVVNSSKENPNKIAQSVTLTWLPTIFDQAIKFVVGYVRDSLNTATHISLEIESDRNFFKKTLKKFGGVKTKMYLCTIKQ